jgi:DNA replication protein DnaC
VPGRVFRDLEDFNAQLAAWQIEVADLRLHGTTHQRPIDRFADKTHALAPTAGHASFLQAMVRDRVVADDWLVSIDGNRYSAPFVLIDKTVQVVRVGGSWVMRTAMARLPFVKPLETFDYQPSIDRKQLLTLASCHFIEHGDNVIVLGPPGVGKTHLAVSLGLKAIEAGYRVLFTTAASLIEKLTKAHAEGRLEDKLKLYTAPRLLIIDEIGYLPIDRVGANLFFQLISRRYERGPMILTSNQSFGAWGEVFGDRIIATAILDRLLHHAVTMNIRGNSYRLKDKLKAGLVRSHDDNASQPGGEI